MMIDLGGNPFGVVVTADGRWAFVTQAGGEIAVVSLHGQRPRLVQEIPLPGELPAGEELTNDGRYLLVASATGAIVVSVVRAERGLARAVVGKLRAGSLSGNAFDSAIEVAVSPDDRFAFVSLEGAKALAVFDLRRALATHFRSAGPVGLIPVNFAPVGMTISPDGRWLYATSEVKNISSPRGGTISVINLRKAETRPRRAVVASADAGCDPVRVVVSPDGEVVWVAARESNSILGFSARRLRTDARNALVARVVVGKAPVGLLLIRHGTRLLVADSNRFAPTPQNGELTVVDTTAALAGTKAVVGAIPAGAFPRELSLIPNETRVLVTNFRSNQLEVINTKRIP